MDKDQQPGIEDLAVGDRLSLFPIDDSGKVIHALVTDLKTDQQEAVSPEVETYVAQWITVQVSMEDGTLARQALIFGTDFAYSLEGEPVRVTKA